MFSGWVTGPKSDWTRKSSVNRHNHEGIVFESIGSQNGIHQEAQSRLMKDASLSGPRDTQDFCIGRQPFSETGRVYSWCQRQPPTISKLAVWTTKRSMWVSTVGPSRFGWSDGTQPERGGNEDARCATSNEMMKRQWSLRAMVTSGVVVFVTLIVGEVFHERICERWMGGGSWWSNDAIYDECLD